ncbi:MAG: radical SAM family heme chaperone HemW [Flavobacteriaceae bacterium]|nr:radical SAM family heme chaperone HemW [Flavobacteriaceae bacterium]
MAGIYIHIPFCKQACYYCDFHFSTSLKRKNELISSICKEIQLRKNEISGDIKTIYFGGGTPSILKTEEINLIINEVYHNFKVEDNIEITLEANPDDLSEEKIIQLSRSKINRLSIGIQSFFNTDLILMNRAHNHKEAATCLELATQYFENISIDLIYGIPGLSDQRWVENLEKAISFGVPHLSSYALTVEPKTALKKQIDVGKVKPVSEKDSHRHYLILLAKMKKHGFVNYEFSNFGKEGFYSQNNMAYWQGKNYLGVGPSAHSFDGKKRSWNINNNIKYIHAIQENKLPIEREVLTIIDRYNEYLMTGLRTMWGVSISKIDLEFGKAFATYLLKQAEKPLEEGLLKIHNKDTLLITEKGKFLSDGIASNLFMVE